MTELCNYIVKGGSAVVRPDTTIDPKRFDGRVPIYATVESVEEDSATLAVDEHTKISLGLPSNLIYISGRHHPLAVSRNGVVCNCVSRSGGVEGTLQALGGGDVAFIANVSMG